MVSSDNVVSLVILGGVGYVLYTAYRSGFDLGNWIKGLNGDKAKTFTQQDVDNAKQAGRTEDAQYIISQAQPIPNPATTTLSNYPLYATYGDNASSSGKILLAGGNALVALDLQKQLDDSKANQNKISLNNAPSSSNQKTFTQALNAVVTGDAPKLAIVTTPIPYTPSPSLLQQKNSFTNPVFNSSTGKFQEGY